MLQGQAAGHNDAALTLLVALVYFPSPAATSCKNIQMQTNPFLP